MILSLVAGIGKNRELGNDNKLLWHIPEDLKSFKRITLGAPMIMGRKTFESLPVILPGREHIILSRSVKEVEGAFVVSSIDEALEKVKSLGHEKASIVGGAEIYRQFLPLCQHIHLSFVDYEGEADTIFPEFDSSSWQLVEEINHVATEKNGKPVLAWRYCHFSQNI